MIFEYQFKFGEGGSKLSSRNSQNSWHSWNLLWNSYLEMVGATAAPKLPSTHAMGQVDGTLHKLPQKKTSDYSCHYY